MLCCAVLYLLVGTVTMSITEDWIFRDALYFCVTALTTVGYGDLEITSQSQAGDRVDPDGGKDDPEAGSKESVFGKMKTLEEVAAEQQRVCAAWKNHVSLSSARCLRRR